MVKFYKAARGKGVKPIVGCDVWITNDDDRDKPSRLLLLAKNHTGYLQLCELLSHAWLTNQHRGPRRNPRRMAGSAGHATPRSSRQSQANGLIVLSGAHFGDIGMAIENGNLAAAERCAQRWARIFPSHFYIEMQRAGQPNHGAAGAAFGGAGGASCGLPVVATHPVQFLTAEEFIAHEARTCIAEGEILANRAAASSASTSSRLSRRRPRWPSCSPTCRPRWPNSVEIAKRCNVVLELGKPQAAELPDAGRHDHRRIPGRRIARQGWSSACCSCIPDEAEREAERPRYEARLKFETDTIIKMKFPRLLPDRGRVHPVGQEQWRAGRPGPRLGRRLAGRVCAADHRPRSARTTTCCSSAS